VRAQIAALDAVIAKSSKPKKASILSVKKLLYGGLFSVLLALIIFACISGKTAKAGIRQEPAPVHVSQ
jgi:hypothetical protein